MGEQGAPKRPKRVTTREMQRLEAEVKRINSAMKSSRSGPEYMGLRDELRTIQLQLEHAIDRRDDEALPGQKRKEKKTDVSNTQVSNLLATVQRLQEEIVEHRKSQQSFHRTMDEATAERDRIQKELDLERSLLKESRALIEFAQMQRPDPNQAALKKRIAEQEQALNQLKRSGDPQLRERVGLQEQEILLLKKRLQATINQARDAVKAEREKATMSGRDRLLDMLANLAKHGTKDVRLQTEIDKIKQGASNLTQEQRRKLESTISAAQERIRVAEKDAGAKAQELATLRTQLTTLHAAGVGKPQIQYRGVDPELKLKALKAVDDASRREQRISTLEKQLAQAQRTATLAAMPAPPPRGAGAGGSGPGPGGAKLASVMTQLHKEQSITKFMRQQIMGLEAKLRGRGGSAELTSARNKLAAAAARERSLQDQVRQMQTRPVGQQGAEIASARGQLAAAAARERSLQDQIRNLQARPMGQQGGVGAQVAQELDNARMELSAHRAREGQLESEIRFLKAKRAGEHAPPASGDLARARSDLAGQKQLVSRLDGQIRDLQRKLGGGGQQQGGGADREELRKMQTVLDAERRKTADQESKIRELERAPSGRDVKLEEMQRELDRERDASAEQRARIDALEAGQRQGVGGQDERIQKLQGQLGEREREISEVDAERRALQRSHAEQAARIRELEKGGETNPGRATRSSV